MKQVLNALSKTPVARGFRASGLRVLLILLTVLVRGSVEAQQHRATHLGNPATRFAPPLTTPGDLRERFRDEKLKPDIASILDQWGWKGNLADIHRAAATAPIIEISLPPGTRMPFMSSRENGKPITLRDVLWAGKEPVSAYVFTFSSNGRRYRCVTPKPCSNFYVEDLGPEAPKLELVAVAPADVGLCDSIPTTITVRNPGGVAVTQIQITDPLPAGWKTADNKTNLTFEAGSLQPGESREFRLQVSAAAVGNYQNKARAVSSGGATAEASAATIVRAPVIAIECSAPAEVLMGQAAEVCLTVRNTGDAAEPKIIVTLPFPPGAVFGRTTEDGVSSGGRVTWEIPGLAANASKKVCAAFSLRRPGSLSFAAVATNVCAPPVQSACVTRVAGIPAILLEVADLEDPILLGNEVTYVIKATNQGFANLTNLRLICAVPSSQEFVSAGGATPGSADGGTVTMATLPLLEPKAQALWRVVTKAVLAGDARFKVELSSDQFKQPIPEDESTQQY